MTENLNEFALDEGFHPDNLNENEDYNTILPPYFESDVAMNDFVLNLPTAESLPNITEPSNNTYTDNLMLNCNVEYLNPGLCDTNNIIVLDPTIDSMKSLSNDPNNVMNILRNDLLSIENYPTDITDRLHDGSNMMMPPLGTMYDDDNNLFPSSKMTNSSFLEQNDFMMVSSEEIINSSEDILFESTQTVWLIGISHRNMIL